MPSPLLDMPSVDPSPESPLSYRLSISVGTVVVTTSVSKSDTDAFETRPASNAAGAMPFSDGNLSLSFFILGRSLQRISSAVRESILAFAAVEAPVFRPCATRPSEEATFVPAFHRSSHSRSLWQHARLASRGELRAQQNLA